MEKVFVILMVLKGNSEDWLMMVVKKVLSTVVSFLTRFFLFFICESKRFMREDVGLQFINIEVVLFFLIMVLKEILLKKFYFYKKIVLDRIYMFDDCRFEYLLLFKYFGMFFLVNCLIYFLFVQEVDNMMENNFNRFVSFKDWFLSAFVFVLRFVDLGFYFDV